MLVSGSYVTFKVFDFGFRMFDFGLLLSYSKIYIFNFLIPTSKIRHPK